MPAFDIYEDRSSSMIAEAICAIVIPTCAVMLRFWSRLVLSTNSRGPRLWWDDWLILVSWPIAVAQGATAVYGSKVGIGRHIDVLTEQEMETSMQILWMNQIFWTFGITLTKLSVLCFYARIFKISVPFRRALWAVTTLNIMWGIPVFFTAIFQCTPVSKLWHFGHFGHEVNCIDFKKFLIGAAVSGVFVDLAVLLLPMPMIYQLHLSLKRKILVGVVFVSGYMVIVFSIGRCITTAKLGPGVYGVDFTMNLLPIARWVLVENSISIFSASLPSIFMLFKRWHDHGVYALFSPKRYSPTPALTSRQTTTSASKRPQDTRGEVTSSEVRPRASEDTFDPSASNYFAMATRSSSGEKEIPRISPSKPEKSIQITKQVTMTIKRS